MKKALLSSIITLIVSIAGVLLNGFISFIFFLTIDIANSLGGEVQNTNANLILILLIALVIVCVINVIFSIIVLIKLKRNKLNNLWAIILCLIIMIVLNVILAILIGSTWAIVIYVLFAAIYIISLILFVMSIKTTRNY